jgi:cysteine synthase A
MVIGTSYSSEGLNITAASSLEHVPPYPDPHYCGVSSSLRSAVMSGEPRSQRKFQGMGPGFVPANLDRSVIDRVEKVIEEDAFPLARRLVCEERPFVRMSSGTTIWVPLKIARELRPGHRVVCIAPDSANRYLITEFFED